MLRGWMYAWLMSWDGVVWCGVCAYHCERYHVGHTGIQARKVFRQE